MSRPNDDSAGAGATRSARGLRVALVAAKYHREVVEALERGAVEAFLAAGGQRSDLVQSEAPGAFELPVVAAALARRGDIHAVVCVGCVLTGETSHDRYICEAVAQGLMRVSLDAGKPVAFGVLTCQTMAQAKARAGGESGNKGVEAMVAAIRAAQSIRGIDGGAA